MLRKDQSINGTIHKIQVIDKSSFYIGDTTVFSEFIRNGTIKVVKMPVPVKFKPLDEVLKLTEKIPLDELLA